MSVVIIGGAPLEDVQALATQNINMDISTFIGLNPAVLKVDNKNPMVHCRIKPNVLGPKWTCVFVSQALNVSTVLGLMGDNVADLKLFENSVEVQSWISQQSQAALDILNLGLTIQPCLGVERSAVVY